MHLSNSALNVTENIFWKVYSFICTMFMKILLRMKGIPYGKGIRFYGLAKFKRSNNSTISIGNYCTFRSKSTSNLIGINRPCIISATEKNAKITIGDNCGLSGTVIGCFSEIKLGNNIKCGANTLITDGDWHYDDVRANPPKPIIIEDNVWLGEGVKVLKGVTIGENTIIGAGSVVTRNIPSNVIAAGNICKILKIII